MELHIIFKALGNKTRWDVINCLLEKALCGRSLANRLCIAPSELTNHLYVLQRTGLVKAVKRGHWTFLEVDMNLLRQLHNKFNVWAHPAKEKLPTKCEHREKPIGEKIKRKEAFAYCQKTCFSPDTKKDKKPDIPLRERSKKETLAVDNCGSDIEK
jgi:DNA-binding transcriptional ArsR family regulator